MTIAVLTANFGGYDQPHPLPAQDIAPEAILVSDRPLEVEGWTNVVVPPVGRVDPRHAAKAPKMVPRAFTDAEVVVWLDGHLEVRTTSLISDLVTQLGDEEFGAFRHTFMDSISAEAELASKLFKYRGYKLRAQAQHYLDSGHPDKWGMWTSGLTVRRMTSRVEAMGRAWHAEAKLWGTEDQIALPVVLRNHGIIPVDLPFEGWWAGKRFMLHRHKDGSG
jgi:hypothetical protein